MKTTIRGEKVANKSAVLFAVVKFDRHWKVFLCRDQIVCPLSFENTPPPPPLLLIAPIPA